MTTTAITTMTCEEYVTAIAGNQNDPEWFVDYADGLSVKMIDDDDSFCISLDNDVITEPMGETVRISDTDNIAVMYQV